MLTRDHHIVKVSRITRELMEVFARSDESQYNNDDLSCLCGVSSWFNKVLASRLGFSLQCVQGVYVYDGYTIYDNPNHCWNVYRGTIIDVTATQFGVRNKVHITSVGDSVYGEHYRMEDYNKFFKKWPTCQTPSDYSDSLEEYLDAGVIKYMSRLSRAA